MPASQDRDRQRLVLYLTDAEREVLERVATAQGVPPVIVARRLLMLAAAAADAVREDEPF